MSETSKFAVEKNQWEQGSPSLASTETREVGGMSTQETLYNLDLASLAAASAARLASREIQCHETLQRRFRRRWNRKVYILQLPFSIWLLNVSVAYYPPKKTIKQKKIIDQTNKVLVYVGDPRSTYVYAILTGNKFMCLSGLRLLY